MRAHGEHLTPGSVVRIVESMGTKVKITGAVDRCVPDPSAPTDSMSQWIGMVTATWEGDNGPRTAMAAIVKIHTGRAVGGPLWGPNALVLRWIGDPPSPEIAQAVYDVVGDRGPALGPILVFVEAEPVTIDGPSYRRAQPNFPGTLLVRS